MDAMAAGDFGTGWVRGPDEEHFESAHDAPLGADAGADAGGDVVHELVDAASSPFQFDPVEMDSHDDYDLNGDGVVDHHDVHTALHGLHDFHAPDHPEPAADAHAHTDPPDHGLFHH